MKKALYSFLTLGAIVLLGCISCNLAAGSYPYAERYEIKCNESELIQAVTKLKRQHPECIVPAQIQLKDGRSGEKDYWYHVYFYSKDDNEIIYTWIRASNETATTFAFVSINKGLALGKWKDINKDFSERENTLQKQKFERLILDEIKNQLR